MTDRVIAYTDGACKGNPGIGGWGVFLVYKGIEKEIYGAEKETTNNRMEILAAINALKILKSRCSITIYTDSKYLKNSMLEWMTNWIKNNWQTAAKKPVKNKDLWLELNELVKLHDVDWKWVKGHSGDAGNDKADELANKAIDELRG